MSSSPRKFKQGKKVNNLPEVFDIEYFWHRGRTYHSGWVMSWSLNYLMGQIHAGELYRAQRVFHKENEYEKISPKCHSCVFLQGLVYSDCVCYHGHDIRDWSRKCYNYRFYSPGC